MAVSVKYIAWAKPVTGTPPVVENSASLGFAPKGIIAFHANTSATSYAEGFATGFGFSDGTTSQCCAQAADDNAATSNTGRRTSTALITICSSTSGTVLDEADVSFGADTFTLTWNIRSANPATIFMLVFGGSDITDVKVGNFPSAAAGGAQTTTGTSFTPDCELYIPTGQSTADEGQTHGFMAIAAAMSSSAEWAAYWQTADNQTTNSVAKRYQTDVNCHARAIVTSGVRNVLGDFTAFTSTGRTINFSDADTVTTNLEHFMAIKGAAMAVGSFNVTAGTGNFTPVTGLSFTPKAILLVSTGASANTTAAESHPRYCVGIATDTGSQSCVSAMDTDLAATSICTKIHLTDKCLRIHTANATAGSSVTELDMSWVSMNSDGFTLNRVTNTTTLGNELVHYWAIGQAVAVNNVVKTMPTETISISEAAFTRLAAKIRTRTDTAITVGETRARLSAKMRPIATQTTTLSESIIRVKGKVKTLATETITVGGGTIAELLAKIRTRSETVVIGETRARLAAKNRALATQTTTIAENLVRIKSIPRTLATQTVIIGENLIRQANKIRALAAQTVVIAEARARIKGANRSLATQTVVIGENLARIKGVLRTLATQTVTITGGTLARLSVKIRALAAQTIALTEDLQRTVAAGAQNIVKTISQTVVLGESINRIKGSQRLISDTIAVGAGVIARLAGKIRATPQTIVITDNSVRVSAKLRTLALQTIALTESPARIKGAVKTISQTIVITGGTLTRLMAKIRSIAQTIAVAENVAVETVGQIVRSIVETITISDNIVRRTVKQRLISQTTIIAESIARARGITKIISQTISIGAGTIARLKGITRTISQTVIIDPGILARLSSKIRTIAQTVAIAENVAQETVGNLVRSLVETVSISDSIVRRTAKLAILAQTVIIAEQASRISAKLRTIPAQTITLSDSVTNELNVIIKHVLKTLSQTVSISESLTSEVVKASQRFRRIVDSSVSKLKSNHPAYLLGTKGQHDDYIEF